MRKSDLFLCVTSGGLFTSSGPWVHGKRIIDSFELILVTRGTVYIREGEKEYTLYPNDYLLLRPDVLHSGTKVSQETVEFYWLHFVLDEYAGVTPPKDFTKFLSSPFSGTLGMPSVVIQIIRQMLQYNGTPLYPKETVNHLLYVLLAELIVQRKQKVPQNSLAYRVHEYIRSHSFSPISTLEVSDYFGYHSDYLSRVLKKCYGFTLQQVITEQRLSRAKFILQTSNLTVSQIALELGYTDPNLFEKFFKYHTKVTPTEYRNSFSRLHTNHI